MAADSRGTRQAAVRRRLEELALDALLVSHGPNHRYLTGFTGSAGLLLLARDRTLLLTDFRYQEQAPEETAGAADVLMEGVNLWERLRSVLAGGTRKRVGFERDHLTVRDAERFTQLEACEPVPTSDLVEAERMIKDAGELAAIRAAADIAHAALAELLPTIRVGDAERDIAARLELLLRSRGSDWHPFPTIVASGPRSALPHARSSSRTVGRGELLLLDFGASWDGYCADITRTVVVGTADGRQREIYGIVAEAQQAALRGVRPAMSGKEADALARDIIEAAGHGEAFGHSLGHGLGLEVHEAPRLAKTAQDPLPAGAVVTVEPGIYLEGWGGVRIEDDIHLAADGARLLTNGRNELLELH